MEFFQNQGYSASSQLFFRAEASPGDLRFVDINGEMELSMQVIEQHR
jgi:hypothetical protein